MWAGAVAMGTGLSGLARFGGGATGIVVGTVMVVMVAAGA